MPLPPLFRRLVLSFCLLAVGSGGAWAQQGAAGAAAFDQLADRLERGEVVIPTHQDALRLLDELHRALPAGDAHRELRYRYMFCIIGMNGDPAEGVAYAERGMADARRLGDAEAEINFHFCRGDNQESLTTPRDALPDYNAGIAIAKREENARLTADGLTWRGSVQSLLGEHALALVDFLEAQKFYDTAGEPIEREQNLFNIAVAYRRLGLRDEARHYLDRLMASGQARHDEPQQMAAHMQLGFLDSESGSSQQLASARQHFDAALAVARRLGSHAAQGSAHLGLAQVLNQQGDYRGALAELDAARVQFDARHDRSDGDMLALQEGVAHAGLGDHAQAVIDFDRSESWLRKSGNLRYLADLLDHRSRSYEALGQSALALADLRRMVKVNETLERKAQAYTTTLMGYQFDSARKDRENRQLEADRRLREEQLASLQKVRRWQRAALVLGGGLLVLLAWNALRQLRRSRRLQRLAWSDPLTGVGNRRRLEHAAAQAIEQARASGEPLALVALDVDHFKPVNDTHGHAVGDRVLVELARACQGALRQVDRFCRIGGEEFVALLPGSDAAAAMQIAERLRSEARTLPLDSVAAGLAISISLGVTELAAGDDVIDQLLRRADQALYRAKANGRDRVEREPA